MSYVLGVLHSEDLLSEVLEVVEGRLSRDGVNQSETLTVLHVQVSHRRELLLQADRQTDRQTGGQGDRQIHYMAKSMWTPLVYFSVLFSLCFSWFRVGHLVPVKGTVSR